MRTLFRFLLRGSVLLLGDIHALHRFGDEVYRLARAESLGYIVEPVAVSVDVFLKLLRLDAGHERERVDLLLQLVGGPVDVVLVGYRLEDERALHYLSRRGVELGFVGILVHAALREEVFHGHVVLALDALGLLLSHGVLLALYHLLGDLDFGELDGFLYRASLEEIGEVTEVSQEGCIIDLGVQYDVIKKSGAWFSYNDNKVANGREKMRQFLKDNPELAKEIEEKIRAAAKGAPVEEIAGGEETPA